MKKNTWNPYAKIAFVLCTVFASILQSLAVFTAFDATSNYFLNPSWLPVLAVIFTALGVIFGSIAVFTEEKAHLAGSPFNAKPTVSILASGSISASLPITVFLFLFQGTPSNSLLTKLLIIFATLALIYEILCLFPPLRAEHSGILTLIGFSTVLLCVVCNAYYYFDVTVEMNAPFKVSLQMGLLASMVYFTGELRYLLGKPLPRLYRMLAAWVIALGTLSIPAFFLAFLTKKSDRIDYLAGAILLLGICLSVCMRMHALRVCSTSDSDAEGTSATDNDTIGKDIV